ncbi:MAG: helix-turn-helix transcriptional regulator [Bacilli bacterium]
MERRKAMDITIGNNMSSLRKRFQLTQKEICSIVGVSGSTYKHYELGDRATPISVLKDLAKFYKVSTNCFFEDIPALSEKNKLNYLTMLLKWRTLQINI